MKSFIKQLIEFITPHFIEEWVMLEECESNYMPVCSEVDVKPGETFDAMARAKSLTWLGFCIFARFDAPVPFDVTLLGGNK